MSEHSTSPPAPGATTAARLDRQGAVVYNLALRVTASPTYAWHTTVAAFQATSQRVPADAPAGIDDRDLLLMACWHGRQLLSAVAPDSEYAQQVRAYDEASQRLASLQAAVARANEELPVDQREVLALRAATDIPNDDLAAVLGADPGVLAAMLGQSRLMLRDAMRGSETATVLLDSAEARQAVAYAALRQDGQLRGGDARLALARWLEGDPSRREIVDALEEAGLSYRAWGPQPLPAGLAEAVLAAAPDSAPSAPVPAATAPEAAGDAAPAAAQAAAAEAYAPAAAPHEPVATGPQAAVAAEPGATGPVPAHAEGTGPDPDATVEWSTADLQAYGLEDHGPGARAPGGQPDAVEELEPLDEELDPYLDEEEDEDDLELHGDEPGALSRVTAGAPRWLVAVVILLVVLLVVVLVLMLQGSDPTPQQATVLLGTVLGAPAPA